MLGTYKQRCKAPQRVQVSARMLHTSPRLLQRASPLARRAPLAACRAAQARCTRCSAVAKTQCKDRRARCDARLCVPSRAQRTPGPVHTASQTLPQGHACSLCVHAAHYAVLGLEEDASDEEVKRAFRRAARSLHPDVNQDDPQAAQKFMVVLAAYQVKARESRQVPA